MKFNIEDCFKADLGFHFQKVNDIFVVIYVTPGKIKCIQVSSFLFSYLEASFCDHIS